MKDECRKVTKRASQRFRIITSPSPIWIKKTIEYVNRNIKANSFPNIATNTTIPIRERSEWLRKMRNGRQLCAIAVVGSQVVGAAHLDIEHGRRSHTAKIAATIDPMYQNQKIGKALVTTLIAGAPASHIRVIFGEPTADNSAAIRLLTGLGFKQICSLPNAYKKDDGSYNDLLVYCLDLEAS